jgi:pilus assembly protein Flp/PilA
MLRSFSEAKAIAHPRRTTMMTKIRNLLKSKDGATAIEYGLIAALIGVVIISAVTALGTSIESQFDNIEKAIKTPTRFRFCRPSRAQANANSSSFRVNHDMVDNKQPIFVSK